MADSGFKHWRGYLYVALGMAFGIYRGLKVIEWGAWDTFDQALAFGMVASGIFLILKKIK